MFLNKGGQIKTRYKEEFFYHKGGDTLEGVAQKRSGGSIPRNGSLKSRLEMSLSNLI